MATGSPTEIACPACRFGRFLLDPAARRLSADGQPVSLGARAFDLLTVLVARAGELVSKNELLTLVWSGLVVEENNLQVQISALRKLLGPSALITIPGRGYRFDLRVEGVTDGAVPTAVEPPTPTKSHSPGPPAPPRRVATNIPPRLPTLYGRAADVTSIGALVQRHSVVTIAGAGGIGKTRVAQAVAAGLAAECADDFPDGVWWVELSPVADGAHLAGSVARVLGAQLGVGAAPVDAVGRVLAPQRLLLVLDNCEHLLDAVAEFIEIIGPMAPGVRILATSQETLKTTDEHLYRLGALAVPGARSAVPEDPPPAVELFVARAKAVDPRFALTPDKADVVFEICRRLDGIPLAIELAAARLPLLGVEGLRERLDERFNLLTAGSRVVLRRHQTLRATFEWSHALLSPEQQAVFRRLGVFAGSFGLEAAQSVVQDDTIDEWAALDHLGALVDKSLVLAEGEGVPRYRLLETARAYALERLADAGETRATMRRHAEALLRELERLEKQDTRTSPTGASLQAAALELDNLRAALAAAAAPQGDGSLAIALMAHSHRIWASSSQLSEGFLLALGLRRFLHADIEPAVVARFWFTIAQLGLYSNRREAFEAAERAATLFRELRDAPRLFDALIVVAVQGVRFCSVEAMGAAIAEAEALLPADATAKQLGRLEFARCRWLARLGRMEAALAAAERQYAIAMQGGNEIGAHYAMSNVAAVEVELGRLDAGLSHARDSIARLEALGGSAGAGHLWFAVAQALALLGRAGDALAASRTAYELLLREDDQERVFPVLALCLALHDRVADAARLVGYIEAARVRAGALAEGRWARIQNRLTSLLASLSAEARASLQAEGAAMREEDAMRLAFGAEARRPVVPTDTRPRDDRA